MKSSWSFLKVLYRGFNLYLSLMFSICLLFTSWAQPLQFAYAADIGSISGTVVADNSGQPISGIEVYAYDYYIGSWRGSAATDVNGNYAITGLGPGDYRVQTLGDGTYAGEYYDNTYDRDAAIPVTVVSGADTGGINFSLALGGSISGTVVADNSGQPISGIEVWAYDYYNGYWGGSAVTDVNGNYIITGLTPGDYRVQALGDETCAGEYYNNAYDWDVAIPVTVFNGTDKGGTNFSLTVYVQHHGNDLERFIKHLLKEIGKIIR